MIEARLGLEIHEEDVEAHKRVRPAAVRCWGSRSNSCNSDESDVLQIEEGRAGAFASAVTKGCVRDVKLHPVTARFKIIALKSIICVGFLRSVHNAAQPSVARDLLELRPSEMVDLCACRSNGEFCCSDGDGYGNGNVDNGPVALQNSTIERSVMQCSGTFKTMGRIGSRAQQNFLQQSQVRRIFFYGGGGGGDDGGCNLSVVITNKREFIAVDRPRRGRQGT